jgi:cysteinyl-tRNA synthetase
LYDTATRTVRDFVPRTPGQVGIYLCGLTVQSPPHLGHLRSSVNYDVLRRWLLYSGFEVTFIRNVTDIDDKIIQKSIEYGQPFWSIAYANERLLTADYARLGVLAPTYEPRATGHIPEMIELIKQLIDKGHAYQAADGSGDVYFGVRSFAEYGSLSGRRPDDMEPVVDGPERAKRDPLDFALWKGAKADEPFDASWPSPWGPGRPGWHIECSAMSRRYLGDEFDIHGGGLDIAFPHHENELAQSRGAGLGFTRHWVHHALLNLGTSKMSKSLGNVITLTSVIDSGLRPAEARYYLAAPHYRSMIEYSEEALREAAAAYRRLEGFVRRAGERAAAGAIVPAATGVPVPAAFADAMNDDLNTSRALAVLHEAVRDGNAALATGDDPTVTRLLPEILAMLRIFGLDPTDPQWATSSDGGSCAACGQPGRAGHRAADLGPRPQDWATADGARPASRAGIAVEDTRRPVDHQP